MTKAYEQFMKQANSQGREYGAGFTYHHFDGLTLEEKDEVISLLRERALKGDTIAISALNFVDNKISMAIYEELFATAEKIDVKAINQAAYEAYKIRKERKYIDILLDNIKHCNNFQRWHAIQLICSINFEGNWTVDVENQMKDLIVSESDEVLVHTLAKKILLQKGIVQSSSIYREKIKMLMSNDRDDRENAFLNF